ncbi:radical SAM protein [Candidatus Woesearchaeota archaeon]|nr:radical SAM protein [Candidatus Woesearchaeota archaeon]
MQTIQEEKQENKVVLIDKKSKIPLVGSVFIGILDRGSSLLQVRATTLCNMSCQFCSTDAGINSKFHKTNFIVDPDYLLEELRKVSEEKGYNLHYNIDSVGEPTSYLYLIELIKGIRKIPDVLKISMQTNGTLLSKELINNLIHAGLDRLNISVHSLDSLKAKMLFGSDNYNLEKVIEIINYIKNTKLELWLTPVWIPKINDEDIIKLIKFAKQHSINIGLQKYETYRYSRKMKKSRELNYWKFYNQLEKWEKEFNIKLKFKNDPTIIKRKSIPTVMDVNDKLQAVVVSKGWLSDQVIAAARERAITVNNCNSNIHDKINIKIIENKNNIYLAELIRK